MRYIPFLGGWIDTSMWFFYFLLFLLPVVILIIFFFLFNFFVKNIFKSIGLAVGLYLLIAVFFGVWVVSQSHSQVPLRQIVLPALFWPVFIFFDIIYALQGRTPEW